MCERAARLCRAGAHRLLREPPPQGRALGGLLRWVGARMGEPRAPLVPDAPAAPAAPAADPGPGPGPAALRGGTAVILDVSRTPPAPDAPFSPRGTPAQPSARPSASQSANSRPPPRVAGPPPGTETTPTPSPPSTSTNPRRPGAGTRSRWDTAPRLSPSGTLTRGPSFSPSRVPAPSATLGKPWPPAPAASPAPVVPAAPRPPTSAGKWSPLPTSLFRLPFHSARAWSPGTSPPAGSVPLGGLPDSPFTHPPQGTSFRVGGGAGGALRGWQRRGWTGAWVRPAWVWGGAWRFPGWANGVRGLFLLSLHSWNPSRSRWRGPGRAGQGKPQCEEPTHRSTGGCPLTRSWWPQDPAGWWGRRAGSLLSLICQGGDDRGRGARQGLEPAVTQATRGPRPDSGMPRFSAARTKMMTGSCPWRSSSSSLPTACWTSGSWSRCFTPSTPTAPTTWTPRSCVITSWSTWGTTRTSWPRWRP